MARNWVAEYEALHIENDVLKSRIAQWEAWGDRVEEALVDDTLDLTDSMYRLIDDRPEVK